MNLPNMSHKPLLFKTASRTHPGHIRAHNEDAIWLSEPSQAWAVADGLGGHVAGDIASQLLVSSLDQALISGPLSDRVTAVEDAIFKAHKQIRDLSKKDYYGQVMGSTIVTLLLQQSIGVCLWVGDSRLYRFRAGVLEQISEDHHGGVVEGSRVVSRAVGAVPQLLVDIKLLNVQKRDRLLLCSDGVNGMISDDKLNQILRHQSDIDLAIDQLESAVFAAGAKDNLSMILIDIY